MTGRSDGGASMRDPDALLERAGVRGDARRDQHFLVDDRVLDRLPTYASDFDTSHVLEIGAGTGGLTDRLLATADRVTAVERDSDLSTFLRSEFAPAVDSGHLTVLEADARSADLPSYTAAVSNLPYGASSRLLFRLLPRRRPIVVMVQREFAERMAAQPGTDAYGRLTVTAGHYGRVELVETVPREAFVPPPAVESAVVRITPRDPEYPVSDEAFFLDFVRALFTQRRKTTRNAIRNTLQISGIDDPTAVLNAADDDRLDRRPETLTPAEFAALAELAAAAGRSGP